MSGHDVSLRARAGTFLPNGPATRCSNLNAPLGDDDRTGLRILFPNPADTETARHFRACFCLRSAFHCRSRRRSDWHFGAHVSQLTEQRSGSSRNHGLLSCASPWAGSIRTALTGSTVFRSVARTLFDAEPLTGVRVAGQITPGRLATCPELDD